MYRMTAMTVIYLLLSGCSNQENRYKPSGGTVDIVSVDTDKEKIIE